MTEEQVLQVLNMVKNRGPHLRVGQAMFISIEEISFETANKLRGANSDPFYDSSRVLACLGTITSNDLYNKYKQDFAALI